MGTLQPESDTKRELDDSGCVQDDSPPPKPEAIAQVYRGEAQLLDLSDDVLLYILYHCSPQDLKALGYSCSRLATLIRDRTLWQAVDARAQPSGRQRTRWLLAHVLHEGTRELHLSGYAKEARGCLGHVNRTRGEVEVEKDATEQGGALGETNNNSPASGASTSEGAAGGGADEAAAPRPPYPLFRQHARLHINAQQLPRFSGSPSWPEEASEDSLPGETDPEACVLADGTCPGPQFTLTQCMMRQLRTQCPRLSSLSLDLCNINCRTTGFSQFPPTLKRLSLRGVKCYNLPLDKSFLFKIHDYLPLLEFFDLSECDWMEPASLMPLSKMPSLRHLVLQHCHRMSEFVAYASLATRYGFQQLRILDLRNTPVGDSEVSALGWIPELEELYLSPTSVPPAAPPGHSHYKGDTLAAFQELEPWETQDVECFTYTQPPPEPAETPSPDLTVEDLEEQLAQARDVSVLCAHAAADLDNRCDNVLRLGIRVRRVPEDVQPVRPFLPDRDILPELCPRNLRDNTPERRESDAEGEANRIKRKPEENGSGDSANINVVKPGPSKRKKLENNHNKISPDKIKNSSMDDKRKTDDTDSSDDEFLVTQRRNIHIGAKEGNCESKCAIDAYASLDAPSTSSFRKEDDRSIGKITPKSKISSKKDKLHSDFDSSDEEFLVAPLTKSQISINQAANTSKGCSITKNLPKESFCNSKKPDDPVSEKSKPTTRKSPTKSKRKPESDSSDDEFLVSPKKKAQNVDNEDANMSPQTLRININVDEPSTSNSQTTETSGDKSSDATSSTETKTQKTDSDSTDDDTTKNEDSATQGTSEESNASQNNVQEYVRFRRNVDPVFLQLPVEPPQEFQIVEPPPGIQILEPPNPNAGEVLLADGDLESRHRVIYVNVGQQLHAVYRLLPNRQLFPAIRNRNRPHIRNIFYTPPTPHLDATSLVTDSALRRFGRADGEDINYVHIGPNGPYVNPHRDVGARPSRSNLRVLSVTGFRHITDRSLVHLATAAPHLRLIDFSETSVTEQGVENFRSLRPDCEVRFSEYTGKRDESD